MHGEQAECDRSGVLASACLVRALKGQANDGTRILIGSFHSASHEHIKNYELPYVDE